jgi:hypothetical protein
LTEKKKILISSRKRDREGGRERGREECDRMKTVKERKRKGE